MKNSSIILPIRAKEFIELAMLRAGCLMAISNTWGERIIR